METAPPPPGRKADEEHLRLLSIFHYVLAAFGLIPACLPLLYVAFGGVMMANPAFLHDAKGEGPPAFVGFLILAFGAFFALFAWSMLVCVFLSGRFLAKRKNRTFSIVVAAMLCLFTPLGTILGIFTLIALTKDSVRQLYEAPHA